MPDRRELYDSSALCARLLNVLGLHAAPSAKPVLNAIELLREMNAGNVRKLTNDAPVNFIREHWAKLIFTDAGVDRRDYELCGVPSETDVRAR